LSAIPPAKIPSNVQTMAQPYNGPGALNGAVPSERPAGWLSIGNPLALPFRKTLGIAINGFVFLIEQPPGPPSHF